MTKSKRKRRQIRSLEEEMREKEEGEKNRRHFLPRKIESEIGDDREEEGATEKRERERERGRER